MLRDAVPRRVLTLPLSESARSLRRWTTAALAATAGACTPAPQQEVTARNPVVDTTMIVHSSAPASDAFRAAAGAALPALVFVQVQALPARAEIQMRDPFGAEPFDSLQPGPLAEGSGSGFVLSTDGLIMTNNHVVQDAAVVAVVLPDRSFEASVVGRDPDTDIAILSIQGKNLTAARLGDSDSLRTGDWVLALGFPLSLSATVTAGIVSGKGRSLGLIAGAPESVAPLEYYIQTDAAINPGNSGGPMVDLAGRVVGVNSAIASPTGYYTGYGFAIPINVARRVADDLIRFGEVRRPALGIRIADVLPADAAVYRLPSVSGVEVVGVVDGGPAAQAGVDLGDVIVAVDSRPVQTAGDLQAAIASRQPGERVRIDARRYGAPVAFTIELSRMPTRVQRARPVPAHVGPVPLGFSIAQGRGTLFVDNVDRFSSAARAGIRPGLRILALNRRTVRTITEFEAALRELSSGAALSLRVVDPVIGETIINYEPEPLHSRR